jgi:hypothetical protein
MNPSIKSSLSGFAIGTLPLAACSIFYFALEYFIGGFPGESISLGIVGIYLVSIIVVFFISIRWISRKERTKGSVSLVVLLVQAFGAFWFLAL